MTTPDVWEWLQECRTCGKSHEYRRQSCSCGDGSQTWGHPDDGHSYRPRMSPWDLAKLMAEWDTQQSSVEETGNG